MKVYIEPIGTLINAFSKLPGVGLKTAQRYAYKIVNMPPEEAEAFAAAILSARKTYITARSAAILRTERSATSAGREARTSSAW